MNWTSYALSCCSMLLMVNVQGQSHELRFIPDDDVASKWLRPTDLESPSSVPDEVRKRLNTLYTNGFLEAHLDSCTTDSAVTACTIHVGQHYRWAKLAADGVPGEIASGARFRDKLYTGRSISPAQVASLMEDLIRYCEDHGYPFAQVGLVDLDQDHDGLHATVRLEKGRMVVIDSVLLRGSVRTSLRYLQTHVGIRPGDPYNESLIRAVERRTRELPFVTQRQRPYVQFTPERTKLFLFLDTKKASSINGIIGIQPNSVTGKVGVTGDLDLRLRNALRRGEAIELNWRSLQDATQDLKLRFELPFVLGTPFGTDLGLKLFKRDSTFLEVNARAALAYLAAQGDKVSVFINNRSSDRLGNQLVALPGLADVKLLTYGLGLERERFDYRFNPRRGHAVQLEGAIGRKRSTTAIRGEPVPTPEINTVQYELNGKAILHLPLKRRSTFRFVTQGGAMLNELLYRNELFRTGGLRTLRGVDEASILCSAYAVGTFEYRFVYEENANFFAFVDQGWWEDTTQEQLVTDTPLGFGVGATFETKAGLFNLTYALGKQFDNPIELQNGKVHFGFTSLF